jgi:uncharacterized membrane protein
MKLKQEKYRDQLNLSTPARYVKVKNKSVGFLIIGVAIVIGIIVLLFNTALTKIVDSSCSHGPTCPMYGTINTQTYVAIALIAIILIIGLVLIFSKEETKIVTKIKKEQVEVKRKPLDYSKLDKEEKVLVKTLEDAEGTMFQSDLVEKSGFDKVKVTRILDRLEGKKIIERKRRGMTNIVLLK